MTHTTAPLSANNKAPRTREKSGVSAPRIIASRAPATHSHSRLPAWLSTGNRLFLGRSAIHNRVSHPQVIDSQGCSADLSHNQQSVNSAQDVASETPGGTLRQAGGGFRGLVASATDTAEGRIWTCM